jgi:hypothetical protein
VNNNETRSNSGPGLNETSSLLQDTAPRTILEAMFSPRAEQKPAATRGTYTASDLNHHYELGIQHERERAATVAYECELLWGRNAAQIYGDWRTGIMQQFQDAAETFAATMGRSYTEYLGGPVEWDTAVTA